MTSAHVLFEKKKIGANVPSLHHKISIAIYRIKFSINYSLLLLLLLLCSSPVIGHRIAYKCDTTTPPFVFTTAHACICFVLSYIIIIIIICVVVRIHGRHAAYVVLCVNIEFVFCVSVSQANKQD